MFTTPNRGANGSAGAPTWSFDSDSNLGAYRVGADIYGIATGGVERLRVDNNVVTLRNTTSLVPQVTETSGYSLGTSSLRFWDAFARIWYANDGNNSVPTHTFASNTVSGMYLFATNELGFTTNSQERMLVGSYGIKIHTGLNILPRASSSSDLGENGTPLAFRDIYLINSPTVSSDPRLKKYISHNLGFDPRAFMQELGSIKFKRRPGKRWHLGWSATDVKTAMDAVGFEWGAYVEGKYKSLRPIELMPVLWEAEKETISEVANLRTKLKDMEARVARLESQLQEAA